MPRPSLLAATLLLVLAAGPGRAAAPGNAGSLAEWRAGRIERLTAPDGWLTLIGLHFLPPGASTVGRAPGNGIVLAAGPDHLGTVTLGADRTVTFVAADASARVDGRPATKVALVPETPGGTPTVVSAGTVSCFVIERGGRLALRVRDTASPRRTGFAGIDSFPEDAAWRIEAVWEAFAEPRELPVTNVLGQVTPEKAPGRAVFQRDGRTHELLAIDEGPDEPLFFVFADATTGRETYGAARFLYADRPVGGKVILDFNRAYNPPCAFTPFSTCPLPPAGNVLPFRITAGEKTYPRADP